MAAGCLVSRIQNHNAESSTLGSLNMETDAWTVLNYESVLGLSIRGNDLPIPGTPGVLARRRLRTVHEFTLPMVFDGVTDPDGNAYGSGTSLTDGLEQNRKTFVDTVVDPPSGLALLTFSLTYADGVVRDGDVHVEGFEFSFTGIPGIGRAVLGLSIPFGKLT